MKRSISRLITFINHLWRTLVSTLVERWCSKHCRVVSVVDTQGKEVYTSTGLDVDHVYCVDDTGNIFVVYKRRVSHDC